MTVLHCQYHTTTQYCLSRIRSIYSRNKQSQIVEMERESSLPFNELHCNTKLHLSHHFQTDNWPPAAHTDSMPDACPKPSLCGGNTGRGEVEEGRDCTVFASHLQCIQKSCSFPLLLTCPVLLQLADISYMGVLFIFYCYASYHHYCRHRCLAQGRGKPLQTCHLL